MAPKKKTKTKKKFKDTKVGKALTNVGNVLKTVGAKNLGASAANSSQQVFRVGEGLTSQQTETANKKLGIAPKPSAPQTTSGKLVNQPSRPQPTALETGQFGGAVPSPGLNPKTGKSTSGGTLPRAQAPTSADQITQAGLLNLESGGATSSSASSIVGGGIGGTGIMGAPGASVAPAAGALANLQTTNDQAIEDEKQRQLAADQLAIQDSRKENESFLTKLFKQQEREPSIAEQREDLNEQYGIQGKIAEINTLTEALTKVETEVANQVAMANDRLGSNNFINNQIAQIQRNSAPMINRLRADINFKTGVLTQNQELIEQAIQDATAEKRDKWNRAVQIYNLNRDIIDDMNSDYKFAYQNYMREKEQEHDDAVKEAEWKRDMIIEYGLKNSINDSVEVISKAAARASAGDRARKNSSDIKTTLKTENYFLREGEDLRIVAEKFGIPYEAVRNANPGVNEYSMPIGTVIKIPVESAGLETTGDLSKADYSDGLNYVINNGTAEDVARYKSDREFQAYILEQAQN